MAKVDFRRVATNNDLENLDIKDGQFIVTGEGRTYVDYGNERIPTNGTPDTQMSDTSTNSVENKVIKEYVDNQTKNITTGIFNLNSNVSDGTISYCKIGKFVQIQTNFILNSSSIPSGNWKTIILGTVSNEFKPKIETNMIARRDDGGQTYIFQIAIDGTISIKDRGTGNLQARESIVCNGFYIIGD